MAESQQAVRGGGSLPGHAPRAPLSWARACYGVDLQGDRLVVVKAERTGSGVSYTTVSADDDVFRAGVAEGVPTAAALSLRESLTRWVEAPFRERSKAVKVLPTLLDIKLPFPLEECLYLFVALRTVSGGTTRALAAATRRTDAEMNIEALAAHGVDPAVLDQEGLALWTQSLRELPSTPASPAFRFLVHLGEDDGTLVIGRGDEFRNAHRLGAADAEQIGRLVRAHLEGADDLNADDAGGPAWWVFSGPGAADGQRLRLLRERLLAEWPGRADSHGEPGALLARAVATRAILAGPLSCNLRLGPLTHPVVAEKAARQARRIPALLLAGGLLLCALNLAATAVAERRQARLGTAFYALAERLAERPLKARGADAVRVVSGVVAGRTDALKPFADAFEPSLTRHLRNIVRLGRARDMELQMLNLDRTEITIKGRAVGWHDCAALVSYLQSEGYAVSLDRAEAGNDERVPFTIATAAGGSGD